MADNYDLTVKVTGDSSSFKKAMDDAQSKLEAVSGKMNGMGSSLSRVGGKLTSKITKPALGAAGALASITMVKGFGRLVGIDTAKAKLQGLGYSGKEVEGIMNSALESVKGTAFGLDKAATTAASAVAAGIKPGKELTRYLSLVGDAAAIAGVDMNEMGFVFNKVAANGHMTAEELNMLTDRGIPALSLLAKATGKSIDEIRADMSAGKISTDMFLNAIEMGMGGAAKSIGENSFTASLANIGASLSRIGANFLDAGGKGGGFFSQLKPLMKEFLEKLETLEGKATDLGVKFGAAFAGMVQKARELKAGFDGLPDGLQSLIVKGAGIGTAFAVGIGPALQVTGKLSSGIGGILNTTSKVKGAVGKTTSAISEAFAGLHTSMSSATLAVEATGHRFYDFGQKVGTGVRTGIIQAKSSIDSFSKGLRGFSVNSGGAFNSLGLAARRNGILVMSANGQMSLSFSALAKTAGGGIKSAITSLGSLARAAGAAVAPFMPLILVLGLLAAAFAYAWQTDEAFKNSIISSGQQIMSAFAPVLTQLVGIISMIAEALAPVISQLLTSLLPVITSIVEAITPIIAELAPLLVTVLGSISAAIQAIAPVVGAILTVIAGAIQKIIEFVTPIIVFIGNVLSAIVGAVSGFVSKVIVFFGNVKDVIVGVWDKIKTAAQIVWDFIKTHVVSRVEAVKSTVTAVGAAIKGVWESIKSKANTVWNGIKSVVSTVVNAIRSAAGKVASPFISAFNAIHNAFSSLFGKISGIANKIKNVFAGIGSKLKAVIPFLAHGTNDWAGGFAYMNEGGRGELVHLPNGSQVIPHDVSMKYAREAAKTNMTMSQDNAGGFDYDRLINGMVDAISGIVVEHTTNLNGKAVGKSMTPLIDGNLGRRAALAERGV